MVGIVLVAHCNLADEFMQALKLIGGEIDNICPVQFNPDDTPEASLKKITEAVRKVDRGTGVLILTDMFGGTPSNLSFSFLKDNQIDIITGVNLPMLIKFVSLQRSNNPKDVARKVVDQGKKNIHLASSLLNSRTK